MSGREIREAENFTRPALVAIGINIFNLLFLVWMVYGMGGAFFAALALYLVIDRLKRRASGPG
jgi:hypothetical protein